MPGFDLYLCIPSICLAMPVTFDDTQHVFFFLFLGCISLSAVPDKKLKEYNRHGKWHYLFNLVNWKGISSPLPILFNQNFQKENCSDLQPKPKSPFVCILHVTFSAVLQRIG